MSPRRRRWLPGAPEPPPFDEWEHWHPEEIGDAPSALSYIVVDELADGTCLLSVSEWPRVDDQGRVRFRLEERPHLVRADARRLAAHLRKHGVGGWRGRDVRVGDVLAARTRTDLLAEPESEQEAEALRGGPPPSLDWLEAPVYDVSPAAREAAKIALFSAVSPVLDASEARELKSAKPPRRRT
jgi:hypothetical protein